MKYLAQEKWAHSETDKVKLSFLDLAGSVHEQK